MADAAPAVLITGATSGLGRYLARQLASSDWQVLAHGRDPARVADLTAELGGGARGYVADLASLGDVRELAALVRAEVPRLDVLVNNAGIGFGAPGEARQVSADGHELRFAVNYLAPVLLTRLLVPLLTASAPSRISTWARSARSRSTPPMPSSRPDTTEWTPTAGPSSRWPRSPSTWPASLPRPRSRFPAPRHLHEHRDGRARRHHAGLHGRAGGETTMRLITDPALDAVAGQFFDGLRTSRALPQAYDRQFRKQLREVTDRMLSQAE